MRVSTRGLLFEIPGIVFFFFFCHELDEELLYDTLVRFAKDKKVHSNIL